MRDAMLPLPVTRKIIPQLARADQRLAELTAGRVSVGAREEASISRMKLCVQTPSRLGWPKDVRGAL